MNSGSTFDNQSISCGVETDLIFFRTSIRICKRISRSRPRSSKRRSPILIAITYNTTNDSDQNIRGVATLLAELRACVSELALLADCTVLPEVSAVARHGHTTTNTKARVTA